MFPLLYEDAVRQQRFQQLLYERSSPSAALLKERQAATASPRKLRILVASATANTGSKAILALSETDHEIIGLLKDKTDDRAKQFADLANVTLVEGDFDQPESIKPHLVGIDRAICVSSAFAYEHFERDTGFVELCEEAGVEAVIRVSTSSFIVQPGTKIFYGRSHSGIEAFCNGQNAEHKSFPVIHINPNWYLDNFSHLFGMEIKATKMVSMPCSGRGKKMASVDPRDVGRCMAMIATRATPVLYDFVRQKNIEVHGPSLVSFQEMIDALSDNLGYEVKINEVDPEQWAKGLSGMTGVKQVFFDSLAITCLIYNGDMTNDYKNQNSPILEQIGWIPEVGVKEWASHPDTIAACKHD